MQNPGRFSGNRVRSLVCLALACVVLAPMASEVQTAGITVSVLTAEGAPAVDRSVELSRAGSGYSATSNTSRQGQAHFVAVPSATGYALSVDGQVLAADIRLRSNETRMLSLTLTPPAASRAGTSASHFAVRGADNARRNHQRAVVGGRVCASAANAHAATRPNKIWVMALTALRAMANHVNANEAIT